MSKDPKQNHLCSSRQSKKNAKLDKMDAQDCSPDTPDNTMSELASIKSLLQGIVADVSSRKTGHETLHITVEEHGVQDLEDTSNSQGASVNSISISNLK